MRPLPSPAPLPEGSDDAAFVRVPLGELPRPWCEVPEEELGPPKADNGRGAESPLGGRDDLLPGAAAREGWRDDPLLPHAPR